MISTFSVFVVILIGILTVVMDIIANLVPEDHELGTLNVKLYIERGILVCKGKCCCCCRKESSNDFLVDLLYYAFISMPFNFILSAFTNVGKDVLGNGKLRGEMRIEN